MGDGGIVLTPNPYTQSISKKRTPTGSFLDMNVGGVVLTPNPYTQPVNKKRTSSGSSFLDMNVGGVVLTPNPYTQAVNKKGTSSGSFQDVNLDKDGNRLSKSSLGKAALYNNSAYMNTSNLTSVASTSSLYHHYSQDITPLPGCIILGKDGESGNQYTTRFKIDTSEERAIAEKGVIMEECFMCTQPENRKNVCACITSLIMSEAFLLTLHLTALALGVAKSNIHREKIDKDIELIHSIVEVLVVTFVLFARCMLIHNSHKSIRQYTKSHQHVDLSDDRTYVGKQIQTLSYAYYAVAIFFDILTITVAVLFYFVLHLGWTTLINNAILIIATVLSNVILKKLQKIRAAIIEDEHKVVLYEAALLLNEGNLAVTEGQKNSYIKKVGRYIKSLMDTKVFQQPSHIELMDKYGPRWNTVTTMEVLSSV